MEKNYNQIILLLLSIISCGLAQGITVIAIPWYFTGNLNLSSTFSFGYAIITFLGLFWGLYAGVIIDTLNRKKILLFINLLNGIVFSCIGIIECIIQRDSILLLLLGFTMCSFYYIIFFPNIYALAQELTHKNEYVKINSYIEILFQITSIFAAALCGFLFSSSQTFLKYFNSIFIEFQAWSIGEVFILTACLYFMTCILLLFIKYKHRSIYALPNIFLTFQQLQVGIQFLFKRKNILIYGICSQIIFAFLIVELFTLLPLFIKNCLNQGVLVFSLADVIYGFGAIIAGLITIQILKYIDKVSFIIILIIITGYSVLAMVTFLEIHIFFLTTLLIGVSNASARITRMSYFFNQIPNFVIGRTNTIFNTINTIIRFILILVFSSPWFEEKHNVINGYKIGICVLILFTIPLLWQIRPNFKWK